MSSQLVVKMSSLGARIVIFSRRFPYIEGNFQNDITQVFIEDLRDTKDIELYIRFMVDRSRRLQDRADLKDSIINTLTERSQGM
jgi:hypothetical protein